MRDKNYTFDEALNFVKQKRPIVNPTFRLTKDLACSIMDSNIESKKYNNTIDERK